MQAATGIKPTPILGFVCAPLGSRFAYHGDVILLFERLSSGRCIWQRFDLIATTKFVLTINSWWRYYAQDSQPKLQPA
ncbi:hypothetical protein U2P60_06290 [Brucella sp. H1_1004]|uniref:hypothetical protein n=1 Tax=Brucella sp. H1_1004 TaxID=3110109 RepID=UPI0039B4B3FB